MDRSGGRILLGLLGAGLMTVLYACGNVGGSGQCGGVEDSGSCLTIDSIQPFYEVSGGAVSDVDAVQDICDIDPTTGEITFEDFTDHGANVTFTNRPLPGAESTTVPDMTLTDYTITFSLNYCPGTCPTLSPVSASETMFIEANSTLQRTLKLVDIQKKFDYINAGGDPFTYPSYTASYTFTGTDMFHNPITVSGSTEFTIGDYDNCQ